MAMKTSIVSRMLLVFGMNLIPTANIFAAQECASGECRFGILLRSPIFNGIGDHESESASQALEESCLSLKQNLATQLGTSLDYTTCGNIEIRQSRRQHERTYYFQDSSTYKTLKIASPLTSAESTGLAVVHVDVSKVKKIVQPLTTSWQLLSPESFPTGIVLELTAVNPSAPVINAESSAQLSKSLDDNFSTICGKFMQEAQDSLQKRLLIARCETPSAPRKLELKFIQSENTSHAYVRLASSSEITYLVAPTQ